MALRVQNLDKANQLYKEYRALTDQINAIEDGSAIEIKVSLKTQHGVSDITPTDSGVIAKLKQHLVKEAVSPLKTKRADVIRSCRNIDFNPTNDEDISNVGVGKKRNRK